MSEGDARRADALDTVRNSHVRYQRAREDRDKAVRNAIRLGCKRFDIADHLELSKTRVDQLVRGVRPGDPLEGDNVQSRVESDAVSL